MKKRVQAIPLDQLAEPPPLWLRVYYLLQTRARHISRAQIFGGCYVIGILINIYVFANTGDAQSGSFFAISHLIALTLLSFAFTYFVSFISSRPYMLLFILPASIFGGLNLGEIITNSLNW